VLHRREMFSGPQKRLAQSALVRGVQDLQVQLGIDTDGDGTPNLFANPGEYPDQARIVAARDWLLLRAESLDPYHDDSFNSYIYGDRRYVPGDAGSDNETEFFPNPENYRRLLISKTVALRNLQQ